MIPVLLALALVTSFPVAGAPDGSDTTPPVSCARRLVEVWTGMKNRADYEVDVSLIALRAEHGGEEPDSTRNPAWAEAVRRRLARPEPWTAGDVAYLFADLQVRDSLNNRVRLEILGTALARMRDDRASIPQLRDTIRNAITGRYDNGLYVLQAHALAELRHRFPDLVTATDVPRYSSLDSLYAGLVESEPEPEPEPKPAAEARVPTGLFVFRSEIPVNRALRDVSAALVWLTARERVPGRAWAERVASILDACPQCTLADAVFLLPAALRASDPTAYRLVLRILQKPGLAVDAELVTGAAAWILRTDLAFGYQRAAAAQVLAALRALDGNAVAAAAIAPPVLPVVAGGSAASPTRQRLLIDVRGDRQTRESNPVITVDERLVAISRGPNQREELYTQLARMMFGEPDSPPLIQPGQSIADVARDFLDRMGEAMARVQLPRELAATEKMRAMILFADTSTALSLDDFAFVMTELYALPYFPNRERVIGYVLSRVTRAHSLLVVENVRRVLAEHPAGRDPRNTAFRARLLETFGRAWPPPPWRVDARVP